MFIDYELPDEINNKKCCIIDKDCCIIDVDSNNLQHRVLGSGIISRDLRFENLVSYDRYKTAMNNLLFD